ncbi:MAG: hypothetical protein Q8Q23_02255 [bacterium]|nr:hypothetical protein [bacterium]
MHDSGSAKNVGLFALFQSNKEHPINAVLMTVSADMGGIRAFWENLHRQNAKAWREYKWFLCASRNGPVNWGDCYPVENKSGNHLCQSLQVVFPPEFQVERRDLPQIHNTQPVATF